MKFRKLAQVLSAAVVATGLIFGVTSCANNFTVGYIYVTGLDATGHAGVVGAYREDNNNGSLRPITTAVGSAGDHPIRAVIPAGGRFLMVLNAGTKAVDPATHAISYTASNIAVFSIGGYGQLSFQHAYPTQGLGPIRMAVDNSGTHLFVLDSYAPIGNSTGSIQTVGGSAPSASFPCLDSDGIYRATGDVTVFNIDGSTGRLSVVSNQQQQSLTYFPVGCAPVDFHATSSYLYTMDAGSVSNSDVETVFVYALSSSTGQLTQTQNAPLQTGATAVAAITADSGNKYIYLIDPATGAQGTIFPFNVGAQGALTAINSGPQANSSSNAGNPQQLITVSGSGGTFLYIANAGPAPGTANGSSDISGYVINSATGHLDNPIPQSPYVSVSGLVCIFEDPSNQYIYSAGSADNSIGGRKLDPNTGTLKQLTKGTAFPVVATPSWCLATSSSH